MADPQSLLAGIRHVRELQDEMVYGKENETSAAMFERTVTEDHEKVKEEWRGFANDITNIVGSHPEIHESDSVMNVLHLKFAISPQTGAKEKMLTMEGEDGTGLMQLGGKIAERLGLTHPPFEDSDASPTRVPQPRRHPRSTVWYETLRLSRYLRAEMLLILELVQYFEKHGWSEQSYRVYMVTCNIVDYYEDEQYTPAGHQGEEGDDVEELDRAAPWANQLAVEAGIESARELHRMIQSSSEKDAQSMDLERKLFADYKVLSTQHRDFIDDITLAMKNHPEVYDNEEIKKKLLISSVTGSGSDMNLTTDDRSLQDAKKMHDVVESLRGMNDAHTGIGFGRVKPADRGSLKNHPHRQFWHLWLVSTINHRGEMLDAYRLMGHFDRHGWTSESLASWAGL